MTFSSASDEASFKRLVDKRIVPDAFVLATVWGLWHSVCFAVNLQVDAASDDPSGWNFGEARTWVLVHGLLVAVTSLIVVACGAASFYDAESVAQWIDWELVMCVYFFLLLLPIPMMGSSEDNLARSLGGLFMTMFSGAAFLHVRVCRLVPLLCLAWVCNSVALALASFDLAVFALGQFAFLTAIRCVCTREAQAREHYSVKLQMQNRDREIRRRHAGVLKILGRFCDCVVRINNDLRLLDTSEQFEAMLLRSSRGMLTGISLTEFLATPADEEALETHLRARTEMDTGAGMFSLKLKDSTGQPFSVHIYHARLSGVSADDDVEYILGICESRSQSDGLDRDGSGKPNIDIVAPLPSMPGASSTSTSSQNPAAAEDYLQADARLDDTCTTVWINADFFSELGQAKRGSSLLDFFVQPAPFKTWLLKNREELLAGSISPPHLGHFGLAELKSDVSGEKVTKFISVLFPTAATLGQQSLEESISSKRYRLSIRLYQAKSRWAKKARSGAAVGGSGDDSGSDCSSQSGRSTASARGRSARTDRPSRRIRQVFESGSLGAAKQPRPSLEVPTTIGAGPRHSL